MGSTGTAAPRPGRALVGMATGLTTLGLATAGLLLLTRPLLVPSAGPTDLDVLLGQGCAIALLVGWSWLALATTVCLAEAALSVPGPSSSPSPPPRPGLLRPIAARRLAAVLLGSGVGGLAGLVLAPTALAVGTSPGTAPPVTLPLPARPVGGPVAAPVPTPGATPVATPDASSVRVRPGDCLWSIAATHLAPPGAGDAVVDAAWRRLYAANRAVVGPDPHLIRPGTRLDLPSPGSTEGRS